MLHAAVYNGTDVIVGKGVVNCFALAAELNESCALEDPQLVGHGRLCYGKHFGNMLNAHLALKENVENFNSRRVAKHLVKLCKVIQHLILGQMMLFNMAVVCHFFLLTYEHLFMYLL